MFNSTNKPVECSSRSLCARPGSVEPLRAATKSSKQSSWRRGRGGRGKHVQKYLNFPLSKSTILHPSTCSDGFPHVETFQIEAAHVEVFLLIFMLIISHVLTVSVTVIRLTVNAATVVVLQDT